MLEQKEIWRFIRETKEQYRISNQGNIVNSTNTLILPSLNKAEGCLFVNLQVGNKRLIKRISRLVAEHFLKIPNQNQTVGFLDWNPLNHNITNLIWETRKQKQVRINQQRKRSEESIEKSNYPVILYDEKENPIRSFDSVAIASNSINQAFGHHIKECCEGLRNYSGIDEKGNKCFWKWDKNSVNKRKKFKTSLEDNSLF